jgi:uncharacterized protein YqgC (DUF456 family)
VLTDLRYLARVTPAEIIGLIVVLLIMGIGLIGSVLPVVPGAGLVFLTALAHRLYFGDHGPGIWVLIILGLMAGLSLLLDYLASAYGAKRLGATWRGLTGAIVGGLIGAVFFNIPGILLGPFIGAFLFELLGGRKAGEAGKAGLGATLGLLGGAVAKFACCVMMIGLFTTNVLYRSFSMPGSAPAATAVVVGAPAQPAPATPIPPTNAPPDSLLPQPEAR